MAQSDYFGIGTNDPQVPLDIRSSYTSDIPNFGYLNKNDRELSSNSNTTSTSLYAAGNIITAGQFQTLSDSRLKQNIQPLDPVQQVQFIKQLKPIRFQLKKKKSSKKQIGFLAQDVIKTGVNYEELVNMNTNRSLRSFKDTDGFTSHDRFEYSLNYDAFSPIIVSVIQDLIAKNEQLSTDLFNLKTRFEAFKLKQK